MSIWESVMNDCYVALQKGMDFCLINAATIMILLAYHLGLNGSFPSHLSRSVILEENYDPLPAEVSSKSQSSQKR
jgi:hypothetical protein